MSLIEHETATDAPKHARPKRVPKRIVQLVDLIASGECKSTKAACDQLKLDPSYASRELRKVHVATYLETRTRVLLAQSQMPAAATLVRLLDKAASEHVQKDVAIHLLNIAGHKPRSDTQVSVNVEIKAGYVIDLSEGPARPSATTIDARVTRDDK